MPNAVTNSFAVFKESLGALLREKAMLIFPVLAGISCLAAVLGFALLAFLTFDSAILLSLLFIAACYTFLYFISVFFFSAMVIFASSNIKGGKPTILGSIKEAARNTPNILLWSLFSATVGIILEIIDLITKDRLDFLTSLIGVTWSLATFFVVPVMVFEKRRPVDALKGSASLFKKRWGEAISGMVGIGLSIIILGLAGMLLLIGVINILPDMAALLLFLSFIIYILVLVILYNVLNSIYVSALYNFAVTGEVRGGFSEATIRSIGCRRGPAS